MCWGIWRKTLRSSLLNQTLWTRHLPLSSIRPHLRFFKAILLAFYGDVSAIQFDRYSEIHGSIIQNSQQVAFSLVFWKVPFLLLLFKFHLARLFHLVHQSIIDLWVTKPVVLPCYHVVLEVPRWHMARQQAEAPRWKDGYQHEGTMNFIRYRTPALFSRSNLNWTICFVITFYMSALPSGSLSFRSSFHVSKHVLVLEKSTIGQTDVGYRETWAILSRFVPPNSKSQSQGGCQKLESLT